MFSNLTNITYIHLICEGYIGYLPSDNSIYVAFRGSSSIRNWITNLDVVKTPYTSYSECGCQVHKGFYDAEQKVLGGILTEVKRLKSLPFLSSYAVKTTGHSLGAALALLTAMGEIMNPFGINISANIYCLQSFSIRSH